MGESALCDIMTAVRLAEESSLHLVIAGASDADCVADPALFKAQPWEPEGVIEHTFVGGNEVYALS